MNFAEISCENVRALLQARGWSLRRLAEEAGLSASTLSEALRSRHGLSVDALCRVAQAMGVTVEALCSPTFDARQPQRQPGSPQAPASYALLDAHGRAVVDAVLALELDRMKQ